MVPCWADTVGNGLQPVSHTPAFCTDRLWKSWPLFVHSSCRFCKVRQSVSHSQKLAHSVLSSLLRNSLLIILIMCVLWPFLIYTKHMTLLCFETLWKKYDWKMTSRRRLNLNRWFRLYNCPNTKPVWLFTDSNQFLSFDKVIYFSWHTKMIHGGEESQSVWCKNAEFCQKQILPGFWV